MVESSQERAKRNKYRRKKAMLKKVHKKAGIAFLCVMAAQEESHGLIIITVMHIPKLC